MSRFKEAKRGIGGLCINIVVPRNPCPMTDGAMKLLRTTVDSMGLSNRAYTRVLKVARTIADLARRDEICEQDVAESVQYRSLDNKYWG
ncbi:MAG: hypothetical protein ACOYI8_09750 [Christensenellales bacterium]|jgi:magnesium chelatase family protein